MPQDHEEETSEGKIFLVALREKANSKKVHFMFYAEGNITVKLKGKGIT
jgi:hypothetical protein